VALERMQGTNLPNYPVGGDDVEDIETLDNGSSQSAVAAAVLLFYVAGNLSMSRLK